VNTAVRLLGHPRHVLHGSPRPGLSAPEPGALVPLVGGPRPVVVVTLVSYQGIEEVLLVLVVDLHQPGVGPELSAELVAGSPGVSLVVQLPVVHQQAAHVELLGVDPLVRAGEGGGQGGQAEQQRGEEEEHGPIYQGTLWKVKAGGDCPHIWRA